MPVPELTLIWKTPPKDNRDATRKKPIEWAFSPSVMLLDTGSVESSFDALSDASIKPLPRVRILVGPPTSLHVGVVSVCVAREAPQRGLSFVKRPPENGPAIPGQAKSVDFLWAMMVEWSFGMHKD
jgi:hypothetical protein